MEVLSLGFMLFPYAVAASLGLILPLLLIGAYSSFSFGLWLVVATAMLDNLTLSQPILRIGLTIFPADIPMFLIGLAAGIRWISRNDIPRKHAAIVLLVLLFLVKLSVGISQYGTTAGVQGRSDFYAIAAVAYAMSFSVDVQLIQRLLRALVVLAIGIVLVSVYRWTVFYLPIRELLPPGGIYNPDGEARVVGSNYALLVMQVLVLALFFYKQNNALGLAQLLSPFLFAATLVLQHRSVWLAGLAGVLASVVLARAQKAPLWQKLAVLILVASVATAPLMVNQSISEGVQSSASRAIAGQGTVGARFSNWRATVEKWYASGPRGVAMGLDLGADTARYVADEAGKTIKITFAAHNHYITTLTNFGLLGFGLTVTIFAYALSGLWRHCWSGERDSILSSILLVLVIMQMIYYIAYGVELTQQFILGVAIAWVAQRSKSPSSSDASADSSPVGSLNPRPSSARR